MTTERRTEGRKARGSASRVLTFGAAGFVLGLVLLILGNVVFSLAAALNNDTRRHSVAGSPSLDSPDMPWYLHWQHVLMSDFAYILIILVGLGGLLAYLLGPYPDES